MESHIYVRTSPIYNFKLSTECLQMTLYGLSLLLLPLPPEIEVPTHQISAAKPKIQMHKLTDAKIHEQCEMRDAESAINSNW